MDSGGVFEFFKRRAELLRKKAASSHTGVEGEVRFDGVHFLGAKGVEVRDFVNGAEAGGPFSSGDFFPFGRESCTEEVGSGLDIGFV